MWWTVYKTDKTCSWLFQYWNDFGSASIDWIYEYWSYWISWLIKIRTYLDRIWRINSLAPGGFQFNFRLVIFKLTLGNGGRGISYEIALRWMPLDLTDDKSTLVQVMAWCHQATSHYLSQCWRRFMSPNGVTRPQWVKFVSIRNKQKYWCAFVFNSHILTHYGLVMPYSNVDLGQQWLR